MKFDYIIAGSGCAGLSLLYRILKDPLLKTKKILVLDEAEKNTNDRTWCFWEKETGVFEEVVYKQWDKLEFKTTDFSKKFDLGKYSYKMIRGIDFYKYVLDFAKNFTNVVFKYESIQKISSEENIPFLKTNITTYTAGYIFNSTKLFNPEINTKNSLLQHFEGWVIKTEKPTFNENLGTLMDFTVDQKNGDTFMYILPTSSKEALVEYTLFSEKLLEKEAYKAALKNFISDILKIEHYEISHTEFGVIPMSLAHFKRNSNSANIINIGTAGGFTKASSGYTFQFIQKNTAEIVEKLKLGVSPLVSLSFRDKMFTWYDRTLLEVIISKEVKGKEIFSLMFKKISPEIILSFLANESSFFDEIKIMKSLPLLPFIKAGFKQFK